MSAGSTVSAAPPTAQAPRRATRTGRRPGWLDTRLLIGVLLVLIAVGGGAFLLRAADRSTQVWTVRSDLAAGATVQAGDLVPASVRFVSAGLADRYLPSVNPLPAGALATRHVAAGELLPRDAVATTTPTARVEVPLAVAAGDLPPSLHPGQPVDVWAVPSGNRDSGSASAPVAVRVFADVPLQSLTTGTGLGGSGATTATVTLQRSGVDLAAALGSLAGRRVVLVPVTGLVNPAETSASTSTSAEPPTSAQPPASVQPSVPVQPSPSVQPTSASVPTTAGAGR